MKDILLVMISTTARSLMRKQTLANLERAGVFSSPRFAALEISVSDDLTATGNVARALRMGVDLAKHETHPAKWVLFLEDDLDVIDGFLDGVGTWLDEHAREDRRLYSFSVPHYAMTVRQGSAWDYPAKYFCCTQAFAVRPEDAQSLADWFTEHPDYKGKDGATSTGAYDLSMRDWASVTYPDIEFFSASIPSFVQHVGTISTITPARQNVVTMPTWPGRSWRYENANSSRGLKPRLLWIGDAGVDSGFAKCTHEILDEVRHAYQPTVLGLNYRGDDYRDKPYWAHYPMYPASVNGDLLGTRRLAEMIRDHQPDRIVIQNDPWNIPAYMRVLVQMREGGVQVPPVLAFLAVDGLNCRSASLKGVTRAVFWTKFAEQEAKLAGLECPSAVIPLGVDLAKYTPGDVREARQRIGMPERVVNGFVIGNVNRNQPRKRMDLTMRYFAKWVKEYNIPPDVFLYLHVCPTGDVGYDVGQLALYYGIASKDKTKTRLITATPEVFSGASEEFMVDTFRSFDLQLSTTQGEGWGLTTMEGMACGVPQIVPDWSALGEWARDAASLVPCTSTAASPVANAIGGIMDEAEAIKRLDLLYRHASLRESQRLAGLSLVAQDRFRWQNIGRRMIEELDQV